MPRLFLLPPVLLPLAANVVQKGLLGRQLRRDEPPQGAGLLRLDIVDPDECIRGNAQVEDDCRVRQGRRLADHSGRGACLSRIGRIRRTPVAVHGENGIAVVACIAPVVRTVTVVERIVAAEIAWAVTIPVEAAAVAAPVAIAAVAAPVAIAAIAIPAVAAPVP